MASSTTYYQYEDVKRNIAHRLFHMDGWKVYGYHADESDFMTDYYSPVYWNGIAEKNGYILVVDRSDERTEPEYTIKRTYNTTPAETAAKIAKLERMTQDRGASEAEEATARAKIETLKEKENSGMTEQKILYSPSHMANPPRCNWHIEKDGVIYDKGTGLLKFYRVPDISKDRELKDWQDFNNKTPEEWKTEETRREMWHWNESEERAAEIAESRYNNLIDTYKLLDKFNELLARFNNVCGGSVGNTESGYYTYEQVKETKYKKELKPKETESGKIEENQCFILKSNFNYGCNRGYVYRIHKAYERTDGTPVYIAYRLGKGYKKERRGTATQSNSWSLYNEEKFLNWIAKGAIAWCELVEESTPYEVTKTIKKHITPDTTEAPQDAQTATETDESTITEEKPTDTTETATEATQTAQDTTTSDTDSQKETEKEESEETPTEEEKADTSENKADNGGDMFATLAAAYLSGRTVKNKKKATEKAKEQKTDKSTANTKKADTNENEAMQDTTPEFCTPDGKNGKLFCEIIRNGGKIIVYATKESDSNFEVVAVSTDSDICEKQRTTTAADARRAYYEYCEMWTPAPAKENNEDIASDVLTEDEIKRITNGEQVQHIQKTKYGDHITAYFATPYTKATHLVFTLSNAYNEDHIKPGRSATYAGFISDGKLYKNTEAVTKAINIDIENYIREAIPDELTAERMIDFENESSYNLRELQYLIKRDYTEEARKLYYDGKEYDLQLYNHCRYSTETLISYAEKPDQTVKEIATEYIENNAIKIFVEYVNHNRTTAALKAIKETPEDKAHMIKAIADCIDDQKTVRIEITNGEIVKAEADAIKYLTHRGDISDYYIAASDRHKLPKDKYNRPDDIKPEQIKAIYHGQRTLYRATPAA